MLKIVDESLSEKQIKKFYKILKLNTSNSNKVWFSLGAYKSKPNVVGGIETSKPNEVEKHISELLDTYNNKNNIVPFIIKNEFKFFYYRGLTEYPKIKGYWVDTCLSSQDNHTKLMKYFEIKK
ncbi:MAG: hypothetical protein ACQESK_05490 [Bacteroidota bacterium]